MNPVAWGGILSELPTYFRPLRKRNGHLVFSVPVGLVEIICFFLISSCDVQFFFFFFCRMEMTRRVVD